MIRHIKEQIQHIEYKGSLSAKALKKREALKEIASQHALHTLGATSTFHTLRVLRKIRESSTAEDIKRISQENSKWNVGHLGNIIHKEIPQIFQLPESDKSISILDVGSGSGEAVDRLHNLGRRNAHGIEINKEKIKSKHVVTGDARQLPFDKNSFHIVTSSMLFDKYAKYKPQSRDKSRSGLQQLVIYDELMRVLKPGGMYIGFEPRSTQHMVANYTSEFSPVRHKTISIEQYALKKRILIHTTGQDYAIIQKPKNYPNQISLRERISYQIYKMIQTHVLDK